MILNEDERERFALYLEETVRDNEELAKQMDSTFPQLAKKCRIEAAAAQVIARILRKTERM